MFNDRNKSNFVTICCWFSLLCLTTKSNVQALSIQKTQQDDNDLGHDDRSGNALQQPDATVRNFSPRLEYNNEWRPVGRGDPLKNDPTYDYSPPALERVRYWRADNESKDDTSHSKQPAKEPTNGSTKKEILMLGMPSDRHRGQPIHSESPHLQPKYTAIRRSYYAHQHHLPTHLMPPPMQTLAPSPSHTMKGSASSDYRHSVPSTTTSMSMMNTKPYYSSKGSSTWVHSSAGSMPTTTSTAGTSSMTPTMMQHYRHQMSHSPLMMYERDTRHQESIKHASYTHPDGVSFTPNNFIESSQHVHKHSSTGRKPWLHELLQKEIVKSPMKSTSQHYQTNFEPISHMSPIVDVSSTHSPVSFPSTTSTAQPSTSTTMHIFTTTSPVYFTSTLPPTKSTSSTPLMTSPVTTTTKRLLIPTTSNLAFRPTVVPMEMTTDALFKHYNQPEKPLLGPMYLIIEGHSKVKKYGKNELDPHRPKIVPIIPKREPVVRIADPNEKRGTKETFMVKHLHTKTTTPIAETTTVTIAPQTTKTLASKPTIVGFKQITKSTTKPSTLTTTTKPAIESTTQSSVDEPSNGMQGILSFLDSSLSSLFHEEPTAPEIEQLAPQQAPKDNVIFVTTPPSPTKLMPVITKTTNSPKLQTDVEARIGTHGSSIESLIDADVGDDITTEAALRDVRQVFDYDQLPESRLKNRMDVAVDDDDDADTGAEEENDNDELEDTLNDGSVEDIDMEDVENFAADDEYDDENHQLIKRIDKLVDDVDDDDNEEIEFEEILSTEVDDDTDDDNDDDEPELRRTKEA